MRTYYLAEWLNDDALTKDGIRGDCLDRCNFKSLEEAKEVAIVKALNSPMYWARVTEMQEENGRTKAVQVVVNEWINGKWTGWYPQKEQDMVRVCT